MTQQEVWDLVAQNERLLKREIRRYLPKGRDREERLEEVYSECVLARAHAIMATYNGSVLPITHLVASVRWYAYKLLGPKKYWHYKPVPDSASPEKLRALDRGARCASEAQAEAATMLEAMRSSGFGDEADVLRWVLMSGLTHAEIASHLGITRAAARQRYEQALRLARSLFDTDEEPEDEQRRAPAGEGSIRQHAVEAGAPRGAPVHCDDASDDYGRSLQEDGNAWERPAALRESPVGIGAAG